MCPERERLHARFGATRARLRRLARPPRRPPWTVAGTWHSEQTIRAIVTSGSSRTEAFAVHGEYARGMVSITTPSSISRMEIAFEIIDPA